MGKKAYKVLSLIVALAVCVFTAGYAFAWFIDRKDAEFEISGSSMGAYFARGTGSQDDPYVIKNSTHMYNLAWLQNTGRLVPKSGGDKKYYFQLENDITMPEGMWLPPIGNDEHPFVGEFNGRGHTISNLRVTTNINKLTDCPVKNVPDYKFSNSVGMFGKTGKQSDSDKCRIEKFILKNPVVEVADETDAAVKTAYTAGAEGKVAGLAVGYVDGDCSSIGVLANAGASSSGDTQLLINRVGYSTFNSILGELGAGVSSSVTGGGNVGNGGSGASFGSSFDVPSMLDRLNKIKENKASATPSFLLPDIDGKNENPVPASGAKIAFSVDASTSNYAGATARETISNQNVGYFLGNQNKIYVRSPNFGEPLIESTNEWVDWADSAGQTPETSKTIPRWFYKQSENVHTGYGYKTAQGFSAMSQEEFEELPDGLKKLIPEENGKKEFTTIRISQTYKNNGVQIYGNDSNDQWSYHGQISYMGETYGAGFRNAEGYPVDENGNLLTDANDEWGNQVIFNAYTKGIALPNCAIWFKPAQVGKFRFVMYSETTGDGFTLLKVTRTNATKEEPFYVDVSQQGKDCTVDEIIKQPLPSYVMMYYEHNVSQEELDAGNVEYVLMQYGKNGAYFLYLDIGASGADDTGAVEPEKSVSAVDFIYDGVSISETQSEESGIKIGDFIVGGQLYKASQTSVYFDKISTTLEIAYVRLVATDGDKRTMRVTADNIAQVLATRSDLVEKLSF